MIYRGGESGCPELEKRCRLYLKALIGFGASAKPESKSKKSGCNSNELYIHQEVPWRFCSAQHEMCHSAKLFLSRTLAACHIVEPGVISIYKTRPIPGV